MSSKPARVDTKHKLEQLVHRLNEHQRRVRLVEAGEAAAAPPAQSAPPAAAAPKSGSAAPTPPPLDKPPATEQPVNDVTADSVVEQLNAIRGGKSFKDTLVQQELSRYIDGLDESEQQALHAYLKGIAQIVSGQVEAGQAEEPSNHGVETKATGKKSRQVKPNVVKKAAVAQKPAAVPGAPASAPKEDTTPPSVGPIVPKKR